jgi:hypothetical protein
VVILALGASGCAVFAGRTRVVTSRLSSLVIAHPGVSGLVAKPKQSSVVPTHSMPYKAVKQAGAADPDRTGAIGRVWEGPASTHNAATLLISLLPDRASAAEALAQVKSKSLGASAYKAQQFVLSGHFEVPGVPGSAGSAYQVAASATSVAGSGYAVVFEVGRVVVSELVEGGTGGLGQSDARSIARSEWSLLERVEPGFSLSETTWSLAELGAIGGGAVALAALVYVTPVAVRRQRLRAALRAEERSRYQYRARGRKTVRRHRAPAWARPRR